ncbi:MAG: hypothetical protein JRI25_13190 [Deltaproteobacteria bacterium]|nr:hypothetical protein [Deltaproteobacteria bacterium]
MGAGIRFAGAVAALVVAGACNKVKVEGLSDLAEAFGVLERKLEKPAITTSLADAVYEEPRLDGFDPSAEEYVDLATLPRAEAGGWDLQPGLYQLHAKSYCLKAGTYGPASASGTGHIHAPILGPKKKVVAAIIARSANHPEFTQREIQELLWAVIAKARIDDLSAREQEVSATLLKPGELFRLNGGAVGLVPESVVDEVASELPEPAQELLRTEQRMRQLLTKAESSYEDLEEVAVLGGAIPEDGWLRDIPEGRWSAHPDGYYIRYLPEHYSNTHQQIWVPDARYAFEYDALGRIVRITHPNGFLVETVYNDAMAPRAVPGDPRLKAYAFERVRLGLADPEDPEARVEAVWEDEGWTFFRHGPGDERGWLHPGTPPSKQAPRTGRGPLVKVQADDDEEKEARFPGWAERDRDSELTNEDHYRKGLETLGKSREEQIEWVHEHQVEMIKTLVGFHEDIAGVNRTANGSTTVGANDDYVQRLGQTNEPYSDEGF